MAIAVDTSRALQRLHGVEPMVLATSIEKIMAPWMDTIVSLKESSQEQPSLQNQLNHSFLRVSSWIAEFTREEEDDSTKGKKHIVEYMVSKSPEGSFEIHWMMPALPSH